MAKFRLKPVVINAIQWFKHGDSEWVEELPSHARQAGLNPETHGWLEDDQIVFKGDWIVRGVDGKFQVVKPEVFEQMYEFVAE